MTASLPTVTVLAGAILHAASVLAQGPPLTARGESLAAFDGRCIPAGCVAPSSNTPGILGRRALPAGRLARLGATPDFHQGLLKPPTGSASPASELIEQLAAARNVAGALKAYDEQVARTKKDDALLLAPIARAQLSAVASAGEQELARDLALERLAAAGDREARRTLETSATGSRALLPAAMSADISLAHLGDQKAIARLGERLLSPEIRDKSDMAAGLAAAGGAKSAYIFVALLKDADPGTRAVAARALAKLGSREAIGPLRDALATEEGPGRLPVAAALKSLGSDAADELIARMSKSPAADVRLLAAEAYATAKAPGWRDLVKPLLNDPNQATRLRAAELLIDLEPSALALIVQTAQGPNPADREEAARMLERHPPYQIPVLRKLLEDSNSFVRTFAAGAILKAARGK